MHFRKKLVVSMLCLSVGIGSLSVSAGAYAEDSMRYNLDSLTQKVKVGNTTLDILKTQVQRERQDAVSAKAIAVSLEDDFDIDDSITYDEKVNMDLTPLEQEKEYLDKRFELIQKENEIELKVREMFYTYFNLQEDVASKREYYTFFEDKRKAKEQELDLGQITQLDFDKIDVTYKNAYLDYLNAQNAFDTYRRKLNIYMGQDPDAYIELVKQDMSAIDVSRINLPDTIEKIINNSYQLEALEREIEIKEMQLLLKKRFKGFGNVRIEMALLEDSILELQSQVEDMKRSLKFELYNKYNNALIAAESIKVSQLEYDLAKRTYDIDTIKYDAGLISLIDLAESRRQFEDSFFRINDAKLAQYTEVQRLIYYIQENMAVIEFK